MSIPKNSRDYTKNMKRIICCIRDGEKISAEPNEWGMEFLNACIENGYVTGYSLDRNANGNLVGSVTNPKVTLKGFYFLNEKLREQLKFWIPIAISNAIAVAALIVAILK